MALDRTGELLLWGENMIATESNRFGRNFMYPTIIQEFGSIRLSKDRGNLINDRLSSAQAQGGGVEDKTLILLNSYKSSNDLEVTKLKPRIDGL